MTTYCIVNSIGELPIKDLNKGWREAKTSEILKLVSDGDTFQFRSPIYDLDEYVWLLEVPEATE